MNNRLKLNNNKKSQMEILGLAIVVVLILVATIFVARFLLIKSPTEYRKGFVSSELASNMINTLLKTSASGCSQLRIDELLRDCAQGNTIICDNGQSSCTFVESTSKAIFANTLDSWNRDYEFLAYSDPNLPVIKTGSRCPADKESDQFAIPLSGATLTVKLDICV